jgi:hypothetical protein
VGAWAQDPRVGAWAQDPRVGAWARGRVGAWRVGAWARGRVRVGASASWPGLGRKRAESSMLAIVAGRALVAAAFATCAFR